MRIGHLIYKVSSLDQAVKEWRDRGFTVEYGRLRKPYNAVVYFSEGPYIELLATTGMPKPIRWLFRLARRGSFVDRLEYWESHEPGWCGICLEKDPGALTPEITTLKQAGINGLYLQSLQRRDIHGRELRYSCFFPDDITMPFIMSDFTPNPRPQNYIHPNGIERIASISMVVKEDHTPLMDLLNENTQIVRITAGDSTAIKDITYQQAALEPIR